MKGTRKKSLSVISFQDFFNVSITIKSIISINDFTKKIIEEYSLHKENKENYKLENLILSERDVKFFYLIFSKKIIKLKKICHVIIIDKYIKKKDFNLNLEKFLIFFFSFIHNEDFYRIQEIKKIKQKYLFPLQFYDDLFFKLILLFLKNNLIKISFCEVIFKIIFFYYKTYFINNFLIFINYFMNLCINIEQYLNNEDYNDFIVKIFTFLEENIIKKKHQNLIFYFNLNQSSVILKILNLINSKKISDETQSFLYLFLTNCLIFNLNFNHMKYLNLELKRLLLKPKANSKDILFINNIFRLLKEIKNKENNGNNCLQNQINDGIIFFGNKIRSQIKYDNIFILKNNFTLIFSFKAYDISNIQILFSLCKKRNNPIFSIILERDNLFLISEDNDRLSLNLNKEIELNKDYIICISYHFQKGFFKNSKTIDVYLNEIKTNQSSVKFTIPSDELSILLDFKEQESKGIKDNKQLKNFKGVLGQILLFDKNIDLNNLKYILKDNLFYNNIQEEYFGIKQEFYTSNEFKGDNDSIILKINSEKIKNFFFKKKNKNENNYFIFKNTDIIKWILLNDGISFLTLVLEYFNNIINNSKAVEYQKEM